MKLTKDQIQKIALGLMMMCGLVYAFNEFLLRSLTNQRIAAAKSIEGLQPKIREARAHIAKAKQLETQGPKSKETVEQIRNLIPDGSPVAWFPPRVSEFFASRGIERPSTRMINETVEKELTGFRRLNWGIEFPRADFMPFAAALADFENAEPLIEIQSLSIELNREDPSHQRAVLNVNTLVRL